MKEKNMYNKLRIELTGLVTARFYEAQEARKKAFNRLRQIVYLTKEKKTLTEKSTKKKDDEKSRGKFSDNELFKLIEGMKFKKSEQEYVTKIVELLHDMIKEENRYKKLMTYYIEMEPIYVDWLKSVKGISTINTANLLQYFGYCEKAKHASSLWKFAGLDVQNGKAPTLIKGGGSLSYSPKLRMLMYRIGDCFVKHRSPKYRDVYDSEKKRQVKLMETAIEKMSEDEQKEFKKIKKSSLKREFMDRFDKSAPVQLLHADLRARRKMVKHFLADYFGNCLIIRGLPSEPVWSHRK